MSRKKKDRIIRSQCCGVEIRWKNAQGVEQTLRKSMLAYVLECYYICSGCRMCPCEIEGEVLRAMRKKAGG